MSWCNTLPLLWLGGLHLPVLNEHSFFARGRGFIQVKLTLLDPYGMLFFENHKVESQGGSG